MNKFLAVFDGYKISESTLQYAIQATKNADAHLVGVFLDDFLYRTYSVSHVVFTQRNYGAVMQELDMADQRKRDEAVTRFQRSCLGAGISFSVHRDTSFAMQELEEESIFADLIIIDENETFSNDREHSPTRFIRSLLCEVHCPVVIVPDTFKPVSKIIFLYDGEPSSLHAIKMFGSLFPNSRHLPIEVFTVNGEYMPEKELPDKELMKEFIEKHFGQVDYSIVKGNTEEEIIRHLKSYHENELVVLGAYGRSALSRWFKASLGDALLKELNMPLFIAHPR